MDITGTLAKLLATENLTIIHKPGAPTASFNVEQRVLTLPVITDASQEVLTMLAAHEVGHALQTPQDWTDKVIKGTPFDFVNVIEDVRIEKFIQDKFPGLRRDFSRGYTELNDKDFFDIANRDINKMALIDRLNLHFKLGYRAVIEFSPEEQEWVDKIDDVQTFEGVCLVAKELSDWLDQQAEDKEEQPQDSGEEQSQGEEGEQGDSQEGQGQGENDEQDYGSHGRKGDDEETGEEEDEDGESEEEVESGSPEATDEKQSVTQRNLDEKVKQLGANNAWGAQHAHVAVNNDLQYVRGIDEVRASFDYHVEGYEWSGNYADDYKEWAGTTRKEVNHMVQRFEMKKAADAYARATVNKTGVLNTQRLHQYKLTDDIFLRQTVTPDGKNHGLVMYVDWSGSMSGILLDTVKQVITLVQFCQKVQIPFDVYTFTSGSRRDEDLKPGTASTKCVELMQVLTSTAKKNLLKQDIENLFVQAAYIDGARKTGTISRILALGGTPLDNAMVMVPAIIDRFRQRTGAQIVSFVALTDGQSSPLMFADQYGSVQYGYHTENSLKHGHNVYSTRTNSYNHDTVGIVEALKKMTTNVSFTNIFIGGKGQCASHIRHNAGGFNAPMSDFNKNGGVTVQPKVGWDLLTCLNPKNFNNAQEDIQVEHGAKKTAIKSALKKFLKSQSTSKVILDALVDQFA